MVTSLAASSVLPPPAALDWPRAETWLREGGGGRAERWGTVLVEKVLVVREVTDRGCSRWWWWL
jgi:hypothetical protein